MYININIYVGHVSNFVCKSLFSLIFLMLHRLNDPGRWISYTVHPELVVLGLAMFYCALPTPFKC